MYLSVYTTYLYIDFQSAMVAPILKKVLELNTDRNKRFFLEFKFLKLGLLIVFL